MRNCEFTSCEISVGLNPLECAPYKITHRMMPVNNPAGGNTHEQTIKNFHECSSQVVCFSCRHGRTTDDSLRAHVKRGQLFI